MKAPYRKTYRKASYRKATPSRAFVGPKSTKCYDFENKVVLIPDIKNAELNEWKAANQTITKGVSSVLVGTVAPPTYSINTTTHNVRPVSGACSAWFTMNTLWAGNVLSNVAVSEGKTAKDLYISKYHTSAYLTNGSTSKGVLTEWVLTPVHHMANSESASVCLLGALGGQTLDQPAANMGTLVNQSYYSPENFPDYDPMRSEQFSSKWKLLRKKTYALEPGGHIVLEYNSAVTRLYQEKKYASAWTSEYPGLQPTPELYQAFKDVSRVSLFCWRGIPAHGESSTDQFGWSRPQLDVIRNVTVQYRVVPGEALSTGVVGLVPVTATGAVVIGAEPMQIGAVDEMPPADDL